MTISSKTILEAFGANAVLGRDKGLTVQEVANINKELAISLFGLTKDVAEVVVTKWVESCIELKVMTK